MKILIVTQYFWPENFRINDLVAALVERGHKVTILTGKPNYPAGSFFSGYGYFSKSREPCQGAQIKRVPVLPRGNGTSLRLALNYASFAFFGLALGPFYCRDRYDLIFVYQPSPVTSVLPAILLKKIKKVPLQLNILDLWPETLVATGAVRSRLVLGMVEKLTSLIYRHCDQILVQSKGYIEPLIEKGVAASRIEYFPTSAEDLFKNPGKGSAAQTLPVLPSGFRVVFAGNVGDAQDFETILSAAELTRSKPDIHWIVVGDGRRLDWVRTEIEKRELRQVHLLGRFPLEDMPFFFHEADVLLVTLRKDPVFAMTIPGKVQSYLASGKAIVAAIDGEAARIISEAGAGAAVPAGDPERLARAVLELHKLTESERSQMGARGKEYFEQHFDREKLLKKLVGWMEKLVAGDSETT